MPLPISKIACVHIENSEEYVFIVPPSKRDQSPIVFGRGQTWVTTSKESDEDLKPPQFFHYARSAHRMMKRMRYSLNRGDGLNFGKKRRIPLQSFVLKGKSANYYDRTRRGWDMSLHPPSLNQSLMSPYPHNLHIRPIGTNISVEMVFKRLFANMTSISQAEQD